MSDEIRPEWVPASALDDLAGWLTGQAREGMCWLLAHADDGVIWGEVRDGRLALAGESFPALAVALRAETLQQARLFGPAGELRLWRADGGLRQHLITDEQLLDATALDEQQWLWGKAEVERDGFTLLREGAQGMLHAPPLTDVPLETGRVALHVRHYLTHDDRGQATISLSRLAGLTIVKDK